MAENKAQTSLSRQHKYTPINLFNSCNILTATHKGVHNSMLDTGNHILIRFVNNTIVYRSKINLCGAFRTVAQRLAYGRYVVAMVAGYRCPTVPANIRR